VAIIDLVRYADLISALFGLAAAMVLAVPAILAVWAKRNWERLTRLEAEIEQDPETAAALHGVRRHVEGAQLGDSRGALTFNAWGFSLLAVSFIFLLVAAVARMAGKS
jgi:hypothetical protein